MATNTATKIYPFAYKLGDIVKLKGYPSELHLACMIVDISLMQVSGKFTELYSLKNLTTNMVYNNLKSPQFEEFK